MAVVELEGSAKRKARGAFFTPTAIADFLVTWAVDRNPRARVLDPTCGDGAFLVSAARHLRKLGASAATTRTNVIGIDIDEPSLDAATQALAAAGLDATTILSDFFDLASPTGMVPDMQFVDA